MSQISNGALTMFFVLAEHVLDPRFHSLFGCAMWCDKVTFMFISVFASTRCLESFLLLERVITACFFPTMLCLWRTRLLILTRLVWVHWPGNARQQPRRRACRRRQSGLHVSPSPPPFPSLPILSLRHNTTCEIWQCAIGRCL